jgi:hypothetical protein
MLLSIVLSISWLCLAVYGQLLSRIQTVFSRPNLTSEGRVVTQEFSEFVEELLNDSNLHGLSLAIVRKEGDPEFGAWGERTEEGDMMTTRVCILELLDYAI